MLNTENTLYPTCPKCHLIPLFEIIFYKPGNISLNCNCGYKKILSIKEYLTKLTTEKPDIRSICKEHNFPYKYFCLNCQSHLCDECKRKHNDLHDIVSLYENIDIEEIKRKVKEGQNHINNFLLILKNTYIDELNTMIKSIETSYSECVTNNQITLNLLDMLINSYEAIPNYYIQNNIINNTVIKVFQFDTGRKKDEPIDISHKSIDNVINYFNKYSIVKDRYILDVKGMNSTVTIKEHASPVNSILLLQDGRIASCACDNIIKIYNTKNYKCDIVLKGHTDSVSFISQLENGKIISCGFDMTIRVWSISQNDYSLEHTIENSHIKLLWKIIPLSHNRMASCSIWPIIQIWKSVPPYSHIVDLEGHTNDVNCITQVKGKEILIYIVLSNKWN